MKKYIDPESKIVNASKCDIITTSLGTETPLYEETDGVWDLDFGNAKVSYD